MLRDRLRPEKKVRQVLKDLKFNVKEPEPERYSLLVRTLLVLAAAALMWLVAVGFYDFMLEFSISAYELLKGTFS